VLADTLTSFLALQQLIVGVRGAVWATHLCTYQRLLNQDDACHVVSLSPSPLRLTSRPRTRLIVCTVHPCRRAVYTGSVDRRRDLGPRKRLSKMTAVLDARDHGPRTRVLCTERAVPTPATSVIRLLSVVPVI